MARVTLSEFANYCAIPVKTASELRAEGIIPLESDDMREMIRPYLAHLREKAAGRYSSGEFELTAERARLAHHQANLASLDEAVKRKELIPADVVRSKWGDMIAKFRARMLGIPSRVAPVAVGKSAIEVETMIRDGVNAALDELARSDGVD